jgi:hypothetical protein
VSDLCKYLNRSGRRSRPGIVLLVTLVLLVVLATLSYTLSSRVSAQRHRDQYIIDYSQARYACDSAMKYALALSTLEDFNPQMISRPNEPDFSDVFMLSEVEYRKLLEQWAGESGESGTGRADSLREITDAADFGEANDINDVNGVGRANLDSSSMQIRGPYGPAWPFVTEPVEFEIGSARVRIEIEDENAKYPIGWALLNDPTVQLEAEASLKTFCEWMGLTSKEVDALKQQLKDIGEMKTFEVEFKPVTTAVRTPPPATSTGADARTRRTRITRKTVSAADQAARQNTDFAKLFHSSLIDTEALARPTIDSESRKESALKYLGMWASTKVNVNTAPRHVLEAAFAFGGDADKIAEQIIRRRREQPFTDIEDLKRSLLSYSDSIAKCEKYITTVSRFFTIKVTAVSGVAKASAIAAITKDGNKIERIAVISG